MVWVRVSSDDPADVAGISQHPQVGFDDRAGINDRQPVLTDDIAVGTGPCHHRRVGRGQASHALGNLRPLAGLRHFAHVSKSSG